MAQQSLLWSVNSPGKKPFFLFGTMHIRDDRAYRLCSRLYPLILQSDCYIGEMDLGPHEEIGMRSYDIHQFMSEKKYQKARKQFIKTFKIDLDSISHLHPLMIMSILSTTGMSSDHLISLDEHLWQYAEEHGKETIGLESYKQQFEILHSIDPASLYKQILKLSRQPGSIRKNSEKSLELYVAGKIHQLYMISKNSMQQLRKKVIYERNQQMVSVINHLDFTKHYFITVGAGHLSGKSGLLSLLKKSGWTIKAVPDILLT